MASPLTWRCSSSLWWGLSVETTSFTYPDRFTATGLALECDLAYERGPFHEQVILLHELDGVIAEHGMPEDREDRYAGYVQRPLEQ